MVSASSVSLGFADVGVREDVQAFGVGGHYAVFDSVVHHFYEMAGAGRAAMQIALLRRCLSFFAAGSAGDIADAGREGFENGIEALDDRLSSPPIIMQ